MALRKGAAMPSGHYLEVRYEALLAEPAAEFRRILAFLEKPAEPLLAFVERETDRSRADRWRDLLSEEDVRLVEGICGELMRDLGYEPSGPAAVASRAEGDRRDA